MKSLYVKDIKAGEKIKASFLVMEKNLAYSQKGAPYLSIRLRDKTGDIEGRVWDNVAALDPVFRKGDIVYVQGRAVSYRDSTQLAVLDIRKIEDAELDPWDYFPTYEGQCRGDVRCACGLCGLCGEPLAENSPGELSGRR